MKGERVLCEEWVCLLGLWFYFSSITNSYNAHPHCQTHHQPTSSTKPLPFALVLFVCFVGWVGTEVVCIL